MKISLIDIGSNLTHDSFAADRDAVIARALEAGVRRQIVTGADLTSSRPGGGSGGRPSPRTCRAPPACIRIMRRASTSRAARELLRAAAPARRWSRSANAAWTIFAISRRPMRSARPSSPSWKSRPRSRKPVFLHQRDAHDDFTAILEDFRGRLAGGVAHCFTGGRAELEDYLALDLHIGVTGWVNDERRGAQLREAVPHIPARSADARDRCALSTAPRPGPCSEITAQRTVLSAAHRAHRRAIARRIPRRSRRLDHAQCRPILRTRCG